MLYNMKIGKVFGMVQTLVMLRQPIYHYESYSWITNTKKILRHRGHKCAPTVADVTKCKLRTIWTESSAFKLLNHDHIRRLQICSSDILTGAF